MVFHGIEIVKNGLRNNQTKEQNDKAQKNIEQWLKKEQKRFLAAGKNKILWGVLC